MEEIGDRELEKRNSEKGSRNVASPGQSMTQDMVAFVTVSETFRLMSLPPVTLAVSAVSEWPYVDVWALEDYDGRGGRAASAST